MKKQLLGTTAPVTAGLLASSAAHAEEGIKLELGGYVANYFGVGDTDDDGNDFNETVLYSDAEVDFVGETTLDNGLTFGAEVQLTGITDEDQIADNYGYMEGSFGRLQFGTTNTAALHMLYAAPFVGVPVNSGWVTVFVPPPDGATAEDQTPSLATSLDIGADENTLTYFTPRLFGFQLGVSYQAALSYDVDGLNNPADDDTQYHNGVAVGLNFVESFGGVDVAMSGSYARADGPDDPITFLVPPENASGDAGKLITVGQDDIQQVTGGINLGFAGITIGGSVAAELDGRLTPTTSPVGPELGGAAAAIITGATIAAATSILAFALGSYASGASSTEGWSWDAGATYETGPWTFGATYFHGQVEGDITNGDDDVMQALTAGLQYAVGPGITTSLSGLWAQWDTEEGTDNSGLVGVFGVTLEF